MEFHGLLNGGVDGANRPSSQLAVLPGATHYDITHSPLLPLAVTRFLDAAGAQPP